LSQRTEDSGSDDSQEKFWVLATSRDTFESLKKVAETLERAKGVDIDKWNEEMDSHNSNSEASKRRKLTKPR